MDDASELEGMLMSLLAQVRKVVSPTEGDDIAGLISEGNNRQALERICRAAADHRLPLAMDARAMVFRLADRLQVDPAALGMLD